MVWLDDEELSDVALVMYGVKVAVILEQVLLTFLVGLFIPVMGSTF